MDTSFATTVSVVLPVTALRVAEIVVVPDAEEAAVARPVALMVATVGFEDAQVTWLVRFRVLPSVYVPVAVNCCVSPVKLLGFAGVTAIDTSWMTLSVVLPLTPPSVAETVVVPGESALARPVAPMVATAVFDDDQVT